jgi:hypothetical protein
MSAACAADTIASAEAAATVNFLMIEFICFLPRKLEIADDAVRFTARMDCSV